MIGDIARVSLNILFAFVFSIFSLFHLLIFFLKVIVHARTLLASRREDITITMIIGPGMPYIGVVLMQ